MIRAKLIRPALAGALALACGAAWSQTNLAAARDGAQVVASSGVHGREFDAPNLIDGDSSTSWATAEGKTEKQWVIIRLAGTHAADIGSIALDNTPTHGHPPEAGVRNFELAAATMGRADEDFHRIDIFACRMEGGRQVFTFPPARARFIKLIVRSNFGYRGFVEVNELQVFAAGEPPVEQRGGTFLLHTVGDGSTGPLAPLAKSLAAAGATVVVFPGPKPGRHLGTGDLLGVRAIVTTGEVGLTGDEVDLLGRFCRRGGGLLCAVPADGAALGPLLQSLNLAATAPSSGPGKVQLRSHWVTDNLPLPAAAPDAPTLALDGSTPLAQADDRVVALAAELGKGRLVALPLAFLTPTPSPGDGLELVRRAVLWAAGMDEAAAPSPPALSLRLEGTALLLQGAGAPDEQRTFHRLGTALAARGLRVRETGKPADQFASKDLADTAVLLTFMPALKPPVSEEVASWVAAGGGLLVLGEANAAAPDVNQVNAFLRDFGAAVALSPAKDLAVAVGRHPATTGIEALSRPGDLVGAWCFQATTLASMAGTPVAIARTFGKGRVVIMDAGFAVDPVEPAADQKKPPPPYGIQLQQNELFVVQCVGWVMGKL